jgi:hypothetical protein
MRVEVLTFVIAGILVLQLNPSQVTGQSMRYFAFSTRCGHGNWQDSMFIAATNNTSLVDSLLANLSRPIAYRKFVSGPIAPGNGGHNFNSFHGFKWHFIPNAWNLVEAAPELCDGCPFTDVDADTAYWLHRVRSFCPWTGIPIMEIVPSSEKIISYMRSISFFPNPANEFIQIISERDSPIFTCELLDLYGGKTWKLDVDDFNRVILPEIVPRMYLLKIQLYNGYQEIHKIIIKTQ